MTRTSVRFWRWRRNPLKRGSDRAEAWAVLTAGLLLVAGAPAAGAATALNTMASAPEPPPGWHRTTAVLTHRAPPPTVTGTLNTGSAPVQATVRWSGPDGAQHTGQAPARPAAPAGSTTTIWLDASGHLRPAPVDASVVQARAFAYGTAAFTGTALVSGGGLSLVRHALARQRAAALDHEWARFGPGTSAQW
ncbi:Rv1733c family protein [Actinacidiphila acididurans]|uniref:Uncharacterized protein n=1 Tax=Actinacidiphila acididurans TaxID=2784346 RepID=A0ABS2TMR8_9ACTN|nr:hypothetical protein [Actinacidiphila acididurans]MBM9504286.1 hypothetical protein [Actinacidiphila acididurans]